jgi:hypothetical protein
MKNQYAISSPFLALLITAILPVLARACTLVYPTVRAGPGFLVMVTDRGLAVQGLRLQLVRNDTRNTATPDVIDAISDDHGLAQFNHVLPGSFFLSAAHDGGMADGVTIEVSRHGPGAVTVPLKWPGEKPVCVRTVSGTLRDPLRPRQFSVSLLEGLSTRVIETTDTDSGGQFTLPNVASGIYFLALTPFGARSESSEKGGDWIAIEVNREADEEKLDLDLGWSSCGFSYTDRAKCSHPDLTVERPCGTVVDTVGTVVSNADVLLLDNSPNQNVMKEVHTDFAGRFDVHDANDGTYRLVVRSPGFYPLKEMVHIQSSKASESCSRPVSVRLGLLGSCSTAEMIPRSAPEQLLVK